MPLGIKTVLTALAALTLVFTVNTVAKAAMVTFTLSLDDNGTGTFTPGHFAVYASDSDDNGGIESFSADFSGYTSISNVSPYVIELIDNTITMTDSDDFIGLSYPRTNSPLAAAQVLGGGYPTIYGLGQTSGSLNFASPPYDHVTKLDSSPSLDYSALLLIGTGTFTGAGPSWNIDGANSVNIFTSGSPDTDTETLSVGSGLVLDTQTIPEPASVGLVCIGAVMALSRRRKTSTARSA